MEWYFYCIKNYANFKGRARRKEYWMFVLFNVIFTVLLVFFTEFLSTSVDVELSPLIFIYILFILIPHLAVVVRRLHDTGKSGFYWFVRFIPLIGPIWLLILLVEDSNYGPNKWGDNPKGDGNDDVINEIGMIPLEDD